jgi:hypothetical protein
MVTQQLGKCGNVLGKAVFDEGSIIAEPNNVRLLFDWQLPSLNPSKLLRMTVSPSDWLLNMNDLLSK